MTIERTTIGAAAQSTTKLAPLYYGSAAAPDRITLTMFCHNPSSLQDAYICLDLSNLRTIGFDDSTRPSTVTHWSDFGFWLLLCSALDKTCVRLSSRFVVYSRRSGDREDGEHDTAQTERKEGALEVGY
jgi:hypothetical protein